MVRRSTAQRANMTDARLHPAGSCLASGMWLPWAWKAHASRDTVQIRNLAQERRLLQHAP